MHRGPSVHILCVYANLGGHIWWLYVRSLDMLLLVRYATLVVQAFLSLLSASHPLNTSDPRVAGIAPGLFIAPGLMIFVLFPCCASGLQGEVYCDLH